MWIDRFICRPLRGAVSDNKPGFSPLCVVSINTRKMGMDYPLHRHMTPQYIAIRFQGSVEGTKTIKRMCWDEIGCQQIGGTVDESILAPCGEYDQGIIGAHRCPKCGAHVYFFCGDVVGEKVFGHEYWCPRCR